MFCLMKGQGRIVVFDLKIKESQIAARNEVVTHQLTLTDSTHNNIVSKKDEAYLDSQTVQETPAEKSVPRN